MRMCARVIFSCFNSRLREEATFDGANAGLGGEVSTHASVRRRQPLAPGRQHPEDVSTHASVRRRRLVHTGRLHRGGFNSRLREEATQHLMRVALRARFQLTPP